MNFDGVWILGREDILENLAGFGSEHGYGDIKRLVRRKETNEDESCLRKGM